jgi:hypothetical protein
MLGRRRWALGAWAQVQTPKARDPGHDPALSGSGVGQGHLVALEVL